MKIFTSKKWKEYNNSYIDLQLENADLKSDNENYNKQIDLFITANKELSTTIIRLELETEKLKKEVRRLKTLCTKNKIDYKEEKKCKKTNK